MHHSRSIRKILTSHVLARAKIICTLNAVASPSPGQVVKFHMSQQNTFPSSIRDLSPEELVELLEKTGLHIDNNDKCVLEYLPSMAELVDAFKKEKVTHDTLRYGLPIKGLTLLHRCALVEWFNHYLCDDEKLLIPVCTLPDGLGWSDEEKRWFRYSVDPALLPVNFGRTSGAISERLWSIMEMVRNNPAIYDKFPLEYVVLKTLSRSK